MPKLRLISGFKDPLTRPRYILWAGAAIPVLALLVVVALGVSSTGWFYKVVLQTYQADTVTGWERSSHSQVSCTSCHMDANATPLGFVLGRAAYAPRLPKIIMGTFDLPLNPGSLYALSSKYFPDSRCTSCHNLDLRPITASSGIIIDHAIHTENDIQCTVCHNRVGHRQDFELQQVEPATGEPNTPHEDFMLMTACYRCHSLTEEVPPGGTWASGECAVCHTPDFELMPANHLEENFYTLYGDSSGHAEMANEDLERRTAALAEWEEQVLPELTKYDKGLVPVAAVNYCSTCHIEREFCDGCHGTEIPHPAGFLELHAAEGDADPVSCALCHNKTGDPALNLTSCNQCHHPAGDPRLPWAEAEHARVVHASEDVQADCYVCHQEVFCSGCHIRGYKPSRY